MINVFGDMEAFEIVKELLGVAVWRPGDVRSGAAALEEAVRKLRANREPFHLNEKKNWEALR